MLTILEYLGFPVLFISVILVLQLIGELLELKGKVVPEILKIRKYFARKKQERENFVQMQIAINTMSDKFDNLQEALNEFKSHYSKDNIAKRDLWIKSVNQKLENNDGWIAELDKKLDKNNKDTLSLLIDSKRNEIINFASRVIDENYPVTHEQFNRIFKLYDEYEIIIAENEMTNGEVDVAFRIINESYETHIKNHTFIEDVRGY